MKSKALFYLNRYVKNIGEKAEHNMVELAKQGVSYEVRNKIIVEEKKYTDEYEALRWIYERISELPDD